MSPPDLYDSWDKTNCLPEQMKQEHLENLNKVDIEVIEGRVHVDMANTLIRQIYKSDIEEYEVIKPVQDVVLNLIDAGKEVFVVSTFDKDYVRARLTEAGTDERIIGLPVINRMDIMNETMMGRKSKFEIIIDDKPEHPESMHVTHFDPSDIERLAVSEPS